MVLATRHKGERNSLWHLGESVEPVTEQRFGFPRRASRASHG